MKILISHTLMLCRTVGQLRFRQVVYRIYYRFLRLRKISVISTARSSYLDVMLKPQFYLPRAAAGGRFQFMEINSPIEWHNLSLPKIWLYNLHYFNDLNLSSEEFSTSDYNMIESWIEANPPFKGSGWEPYPLSLRIVNWIKFFNRNSTTPEKWLNSLALQAYALSKQVEYHILANHLFVNGKALVFAGCFLEGTEAIRWLETGLAIMDAEIAEQFLNDGGHFELSPMYHASLLWDMCDLVNLALYTQNGQLKLRINRWKQTISRGITWLRTMQHPDGGIPFFNDSAFGIAPTLSNIEIYAANLDCLPADQDLSPSKLSAEYLLDSGYAIINFDTECKALLNISQISPSYQPGHAHADTLSYELSLFGQRTLVNSGTSQYGEDTERQRQRSTAAHNTVEVDFENSSEVWAGFRVARRAYAKLKKFQITPNRIVISGCHDGYTRLKGKNFHVREWIAEPTELKIVDKVTGKYDVAVSRLYLHPNLQASLTGEKITLYFPNGKIAYVSVYGASELTLVSSTWHPSFGKSVSNQCINATFYTGELITQIKW